MDQKTHDKGLEIRKAVLGEAYVNNALKNVDSFNKPFQDLLNEYCWGAVWGREELPRKTRSMLNIAMISILNRPHELRAHLKGALTNGVTRDEIREILMQVAIYGGMPAGRRQFPHRARSVRRNRQGLRPIIMDIGFIGLGKMGFPMARRLIEAKHQLVVFDTRKEAVDRLVAMGAQAASSPKDVADRVETRDGEPALAAGLARGRHRNMAA